MINKKIYISLLSTILASSISHAEVEVTGKITHEYAEFTNSKSALTKNQPLGS